MKENTLVKILKYGIYITALVPLVIFSDFISPFHFGKVVVFRSIIEILFIFYLILVWRNKSYLSGRSSILGSFFAFTLAFGITTLTSIQLYDSFWGSLERMGGFWSFLHYFIYFSILVSVFRKKEDWLKLIEVALAVGFISALYGFGQKTNIEFFVGSGNRARIFGTIGNAALFSGYELIVTFLSLIFLFRKDVLPVRRIFYGVTFFISSLAILMTAVRGSILGLAVGLFIFLTLYVFISKSRKARLYLVYLIVLIILLFTMSQIFKDSKFIKNSRYLTRITDISLQSYTVQTRFWAWEAGIKGWKDSFKTTVLGWGPENFNIPFSNNFNPKFYIGPGSETLFDRAHNMFVEVLVTMGLVGLFSYLSIFYFALTGLWRKLAKAVRNEFAIYYLGLISLIVAYMIHNFFFFDTSANFILFFTVLGFINFLFMGAPEIAKNQKIYHFQTIICFILLLAVGVLIYKTNIIPSRANYATTRGIVRSWQGDYVGAVDKFKESLDYNTFGSYEYRHRYAQLVFENFSKLKDKKYIFDAINEVQKNSDSRPVDYLPHLYLSRLNILLGKDDPNSEYNDISLAHSNRAIELSPTFVRAYYESGQAYINKKQLDKAAEQFKIAAELNPDVGVSYWYWGMAEAEAGNLDEAAGLLEKALTATYPNSVTHDELLRIIKIYSDRNNFKMLALIYEKLIGLQPKNAEYHASLAYVYSRLGIINEAVKQAKIATELDSSFEAEARAFVQSLGRTW
ncbi:MAG: hypothetical protein A2817_03185 [Candidatus Yanofskybacteria bacterium RIFCSPHIGHO2_01_FULL_39_8b]|uniref:O-antigen ligase-related domain-containing protein n=1 Tax=Candidatus Yanofskybacteria bacterium RIFCSPHIGHO2_01_FULL_39_8b TaxID=1802659 RepID=A0A1F8EII2_9BACT|nr:MAG: hypothetical protein A2817_03185 [Candidatus Yanofskybacteria bacterium RIFCSPHIGHO2_01_FULL_39_8b]